MSDEKNTLPGRSLWSNPKAAWTTPLAPDKSDFRDLSVTKEAITAAAAARDPSRACFEGPLDPDALNEPLP